MDRRKPMLAIATLVLAACAGTGPTKATPEEMDSVFRALRSCAVKNIASMDDGISDAGTLAVALAAVCGVEYRAVSAAAAKGLDAMASRRFYELRERQQTKVEMLLPIVLEFRNYLRQGAARPG